MVELDQRAAEAVRKYCTRLGNKCRHVITYAGSDNLYQCSVQSPNKVVDAFSGDGCTRVLLLKYRDKKVVPVQGIMTEEGFTEVK